MAARIATPRPTVWAATSILCDLFQTALYHLCPVGVPSRRIQDILSINEGRISITDTQIEWTDATWNPVAGCSIISAGCTNCYAMKMARRLEAMGAEKHAGLTRKSGRRAAWNDRVRGDWATLKAPYS